MEGFTIVDGIVLAIIAVSGILAYSRGFVREVMSIVGWVAAAIVAFIFAPVIEPLMREVPYLSELIGGNCELGLMAGFAAAFAVALVIFAIFTPLISGLVQNSAVSPIDKGLGFMFGVVRAVLLVIVAFIIYDRLIGPEGGVAQVDNSRSREILAESETKVFELLPQDAPQWVASKFGELTQSCGQ